ELARVREARRHLGARGEERAAHSQKDERVPCAPRGREAHDRARPLLGHDQGGDRREVVRLGRMDDALREAEKAAEERRGHARFVARSCTVMPPMPDLVRFGVAMERPLLEDFDALVTLRGVTRSELLRDLVRAEVSRTRVTQGVPAVASLTLVYDHHVRDLTE